MPSNPTHALTELFGPFKPVGEPGATLAHFAESTTADARALDALRGRVEALELGKTLGEGGMGLVRLGTQNRLGRRVAVKTLRPGSKREIATNLLQEAWVTGSLEHPNIVPIYDLTMDAEDLPQVVLKRIEGTVWTELLDDVGLLDEPVRDDPIAWHLGVLASVCNAVEFAHSRGIIHRDLKPDNIMVGGFGEVYLLDWGIAVSLDEGSDGRFPLASEQRFPTGTPVYMAPEMVAPDGSGLVRRTDVFLLGGLLYRVLAGRPPREGESLYDVLAAVSDPIPLDESWPEDLRELLSAAFSLEPAARPSATEFREALQLHLSRRGTLSVLQHALRGSEELSALLDAVEPADRIEVYDRFGAARFGLREVLVQWPEHSGAQQALADMRVGVARYELDQGDPRAAHVLVAGLPSVPDDVLDGIEALQISIATDRDRLVRLSAEADSSAGARTRIAVLAGLAVIWMGSPLLLPLLGIGPGYGRALGVASMQLAGTGFAYAFAYRSGFRTHANRTLWTLLLLEPLLNTLQLVAGWNWGLNIDQATVLELILATTLISAGTLLIDRRMLPTAFAFFGVSLFAILYPEWVRVAIGPIISVLVINALLVWGWRGQPAKSE